jgi:hypothetical protein
MTQMAVGKEMLYDKLPADVKPRVVWREKFWLTDEALSVYNRVIIKYLIPNTDPSRNLLEQFLHGQVVVVLHCYIWNRLCLRLPRHRFTEGCNARLLF